jgi:IS30 family transposase
MVSESSLRPGPCARQHMFLLGPPAQKEQIATQLGVTHKTISKDLLNCTRRYKSKASCDRQRSEGQIATQLGVSKMTITVMIYEVVK